MKIKININKIMAQKEIFLLELHLAKLREHLINGPKVKIWFLRIFINKWKKDNVKKLKNINGRL
jgi:hypothetical protein